MEQLRIHKMKYRNRGVANRKLRGQQEYHVIFKFGTDKEASDFIDKVKGFWYSHESVKDKVINALNEQKDEPKESIKPGPKKGQGGRPLKKSVQGQKR